jgi:hypothetical protein
MVAADTSLELEASLQSLGVPLASILEAHGCSGDWCKDSAARIAIGAWLLRFIDRWTVQSQAPRLSGGEEDVTALARVAEAMGVAPAGQGAVFLGLSGGSLSHRPASSAATSARGQKGGKGGAAHGGSDASTPAPWQPGDGMEMLRRAIDLAKEAEEWDNAGGWQVIERRRAGDRSVISEVARVASLSGNADGAEVFSTSTQLVLPQMPAPVLSAMAGLKAEHAGGHAKAGKAWAASLEDELVAVRNTHAERERELGDAKARAERGFAFDGSEADTVEGVRDVETGKLVEALSAMNESVDKVPPSLSLSLSLPLSASHSVRLPSLAF